MHYFFAVSAIFAEHFAQLSYHITPQALTCFHARSHLEQFIITRTWYIHAIGHFGRCYYKNGGYIKSERWIHRNTQKGCLHADSLQ